MCLCFCLWVAYQIQCHNKICSFFLLADFQSPLSFVLLLVFFPLISRSLATLPHPSSYLCRLVLFVICNISRYMLGMGLVLLQFHLLVYSVLVQALTFQIIVLDSQHSLQRWLIHIDPLIQSAFVSSSLVLSSLVLYL